MAGSKFDSKSFNPQAFDYKVGHIANLKTNEMRKSKALKGNSEIKNLFSSQSGTGYAVIAEKGLLDGDAVNYDGATDITATSTKTFERGVVVIGRAKAWTEKDFSDDISGQDFMGNVAAQVAEYWDGIDQAIILSILKGIYSMTGTKNVEFIKKHTYDASNEAACDANGNHLGYLSATTLNTAGNQACGKNKKKFTMVFMHSDTATNIENLKLLKYMTYTDADGITRDLAIGTWNGKLVIVDDDMPVEKVYYDAEATTTGALKVVTSGATTGQITLTNANKAYAGTKTLAADNYVIEGSRYVTYELGDGAFDFENIGAKVPSEMSRDPKTNGGQDTLYSRQRKVFSPEFISYTKASQSSNSPTNAELETGANWTLVHSGEASESDRTYINHKCIAIARIFSRG